jgi:hypothetical protein
VLSPETKSADGRVTLVGVRSRVQTVAPPKRKKEKKEIKSVVTLSLDLASKM